jgi:Tol biopolymer transport system component
MKRTVPLMAIVLGLLLALSPDTAAQKSQSADVLLGAALHQEEVDGNLEAAIETYKKILAEYPDNRPIAAKALLQMGRCYEKLGTDGARKAYERLVRDYADQNEAAAQARTRLMALLKPAPVSQEPTLSIRKVVWTPPDMGNIEGSPSPDGRSLSFTDWETGDLAVVDLETGTTRRLTDKGSWEESEEFAMFSRWSPDGRQIAYDWYDGRSMDLRVISAAGGAPRTILDNENEEWSQVYDWSPDSRHILVLLENENGQGQIIRVAAADGSAKVVKSFEGPARFSHTMRFSPDDRYIAYDRPQGEGAAECDIFLIPVNGGPEVPLVDHPADDQLLGWSPGGEGILFASDRSGALDIWFLGVSNGKLRGAPAFVKSGVEEIVPLGFSKGGSFFYALGRTTLDVYFARMDRQSGRVLAQPEKAVQRFEGLNSWPEFSPDGKYLAYVSSRSRAFQGALKPNIIRIRSLETGQERVFTTNFKRLAGTRWSPDGRSLYLAAWDDQGMGIYRADTQTGAMSPVVREEGPQHIYCHDVSADGRTLVFVRQNEGPPPEGLFRIVSRDLVTGEEKNLYTSEAGQRRLIIALSPDGEQLAFVSRNERRTLRVMPAKGGPARDALTYEEKGFPYTPLEWAADGKSILFTRSPSSTQRSLWRISAKGGEAQDLGLAMANFENLSAHPDGTRLAFTSIGPEVSSPSIWVMENFVPPAVAAPGPVTMTSSRLENPPADTPSGAVSPDGRHYSYWDWRTGDLAVRDLQTGRDRRLTDEGTEGKEGSTVDQMAGGSTWSSDGKQIAYNWYISKAGATRSELRIVGLDGGRPRVLSHGDGIREMGSLAWSQDGKYIAASVYPQNGSPRMQLFSAADGTTRTFMDLKREISTTRRFSPDSHYIAYDYRPDEMSPERDIFLMSIDTGQETPLIKHPADDYLLGWSRDGQWIVFASDRTGALGLWVVGMSGVKTQGEPQLVKPGIDLIQPIGLTREGALYYGVVRATEDVYIADLDPTTGKVIGPPRMAIEQFEGGNFTPSYSPDGRYLAYVSRRGNSPYPTNVGNALCIRSLDTGQERVFYREIWRLGLRFIGGPRWSPDGQFITFGGSEGISFTDSYRIDLQTGEITRILRCGPDEQLTGAAYGPDGKHFYGRGNSKAGYSQIIVQDLDSGEVRERYRLAGERRIDVTLSPDGRWLSFINGGWGATRSLRIMPATGGDAREIWSFGETKPGMPSINHTWTPDGRYILFGAPDPSDPRSWELWRIPVEGGKPEKMGLQRGWGIWHISVRPDGRQLVFAGRGGASTDSELWVLENFLPKK